MGPMTRVYSWDGVAMALAHEFGVGIQPTEIELGLSDGLMTEVTSGIAAGDRVLMPLARGGGRGGRP